jgi:hypothetical protein
MLRNIQNNLGPTREQLSHNYAQKGIFVSQNRARNISQNGSGTSVIHVFPNTCRSSNISCREMVPEVCCKLLIEKRLDNSQK